MQRDSQDFFSILCRNVLYISIKFSLYIVFENIKLLLFQVLLPHSECLPELKSCVMQSPMMSIKIRRLGTEHSAYIETHNQKKKT